MKIHKNLLASLIPESGSMPGGASSDETGSRVKSKTKRVAIVVKCVPPYRFPIFKALVKSAPFKPRFFANMPWDWSVPNVRQTLDIIKPPAITITGNTRHKQVGVKQEEPVTIPMLLPLSLLVYRPKLIISGNMGPVSLISVIVAKLLRCPFVLWTEEIASTAGEISRLQKILRAVILPRTSAFLAWGQPAVDFIVSQGFDKEKVHYCAQAVDNDWWIEQSARVDRDGIRERLGLRGRTFLLIGQLISRKGFDKAMQAWARLERPLQEQNSLLIVGAGEDDEKLKQLARELDIPNIIFAGGKAHHELPEMYAAADVHVFPSLVDVWGMVVNEAMACGKPVLASKYAGASQELISNDGRYGELIDPLDIDSMTTALRRWIEREQLPSPTSLQQRIQKVNFDVSVKAFEAVVEQLT